MVERRQKEAVKPEDSQHCQLSATQTQSVFDELERRRASKPTAPPTILVQEQQLLAPPPARLKDLKTPDRTVLDNMIKYVHNDKKELVRNGTVGESNHDHQSQLLHTHQHQPPSQTAQQHFVVEKMRGHDKNAFSYAQASMYDTHLSGS